MRVSSDRFDVLVTGQLLHGGDFNTVWADFVRQLAVPADMAEEWRQNLPVTVGRKLRQDVAERRATMIRGIGLEVELKPADSAAAAPVADEAPKPALAPASTPSASDISPLPVTPVAESEPPHPEPLRETAIPEFKAVESDQVAPHPAADDDDHAVPTLAPIGFAPAMPAPAEFAVQPALAPLMPVPTPTPPPMISRGSGLSLDVLAPAAHEAEESLGWLSSAGGLDQPLDAHQAQTSASSVAATPAHLPLAELHTPASAAPLPRTDEPWLTGMSNSGRDFLGAPELVAPTTPVQLAPLPVSIPAPAPEPVAPLPPPSLAPNSGIAWETVSIPPLEPAKAVEAKVVSVPSLELIPIEPRAAGDEPRRTQQGDTYFTPAYAEHSATGGRTEKLHFSFKGDGGEFFRIWIVNQVLTLLTLGIYSAWAKVRTQQYFHGNTVLDASSFGYLAKPVAILKGRVLAVILFALYLFAEEFSAEWAAIAGGVLMLAIPWVVWSSLRFRAATSSYRNVRFSFHGGVGELYWLFLQTLLLTPVTAGLILPYSWFRWHQYVASNMRYGDMRFEFVGQLGLYYRSLVLGYILIMAALAAAAALVFDMIELTVALAPVFMLAYYLVWQSYMKVVLTNLLYSNTRLGPHWLEANYGFGSYSLLFSINVLFTVISLGLYYPWARVRMAQYRAKHIGLRMNGSLDRVVADQQQRANSLGEGMSDVFDVDIAL